MGLSLIVTCKGRIQHLKQTLPHMMFQWDIDFDEYEIILVDYNDPDNSFVWGYQEAKRQKFKRFKSIRVVEPILLWSPSHSRNIAAKQSSGSILFFVDADILLGKTDVSRVMNHFQNNDCVIWRRDVLPKSKGSGDLNGTFACTRESFFYLRGFNEAATGWTLEDIDLFIRYESFQKTSLIRDCDLEYKAIRHSDDLREKYSGYNSKKENRDIGFGILKKTRNNVNPNGWGESKIKVLSNEA